MIKPVLTTVFLASVLIAGTNPVLASDRYPSYREQGAQGHQHEWDGRERQSHQRPDRYRHRDGERDRYSRHEYREFAYRHHHPDWRWARYRHQHRYYVRPRMVVYEHDIMAPVIAGAILGAVIVGSQQR